MGRTAVSTAGAGANDSGAGHSQGNSVMIRCKRMYLPPEKQDGVRVLVERLWPRGMSKQAAAIEDWMKEISPTPELRRWFGHDFTRWEEFKQRYRNELDANPKLVKGLLELARRSNLTLVYAAKDEPGNSAQILRDYLLIRLGND